MNHRPGVVVFHNGYAGSCTCKARGPRVGARWEAEDWGEQHLREVRRVRSHLRGRSPSLRDQYDYYRRMQADPDTPETDRLGWKVLADGLEHRLGVETEVDALF